MTSPRPCLPAPPDDPELPGAAELLGAAGAGCVARHLDQRGLEPHRIEPVQAHYRPGRSLIVCFRTAAADRSTGRPAGLTVTVERRAGEPGAVWVFPEDPALPGLAVAADGPAAGRRLRPRPTGLEVEPLRYRPRRRAVLRYRLAAAGGYPAGAGDDVLFAKVVTPARARRLMALAEALGAGPDDATATTGPGSPGALRLALPTSRIAPGVLVLPGLAGPSLRDLLLAGGPLPDPGRLARLTVDLHRRCLPALTATAPEPAASRRRFDPLTALGAGELATRLLPGAGPIAGRVAEAVIGWSEASGPSEEWVVHGDLYENQVLVDGDTFGLLDLDDLGPGDPLVDAANFSAHLLLLGRSGPPAAATILRYREELRAAFCHRLDADPAALDWREAYCLLRLAGGPFRVLHPEWPRRISHRLGLAAELLPVRRLPAVTPAARGLRR